MGKTRKPVIVVHGVAGTWHPIHSRPALASAKKAAETGFDMLRNGGTVVDSVTEAVALMEDEGLRFSVEH